MSDSKAFPFSVEVKGASYGYTSADAEITVLDGHDEVRGTGRGTLTLNLPVGLYAIQVERAGTQNEEVCRHSGPETVVELGEPKRFSAVPATDTATSHEYYQEPAIEWSNKPTAAPLPADPGPMGSLFMFVRAPSAEAIKRPLEEIGLGILDYSGRELAALNKHTTAWDTTTGWLAFNADVPAGDYALRYKPPDDEFSPAREMAIGVFPGWQTQIFMTLTNGPSFASASVLMGHGFHPDDHIAQAVDAALTGLQNATDLLLREQRQLLLYGKFENPMLGLVGAHALFQAADVGEATIETIVENLGRLLGRDAPDLRALQLIASRRFGNAVDPRPFERPPMLRGGLEAVLEAAVVTPELVPPGGLLAQISVQRFVDSPWSTWHPLLEPVPAALGGVRAVPAPEWVRGYVEDAARQAARKNEAFDVATIAARAALPPASVADAYDDVRSSVEAGVTRTNEMESVATPSGRETGLALSDPTLSRHFVNIGPDGTFKPSGAVQTRPEDVDAILDKINDASDNVAIHFHGGLVSEAKGLELASRIVATYETAGAYPITIVWETGLLETLTRNLATVNQTKLFNKLVNYAIRHAAKWLGASVGARGPGQPMSMAEIEAARASDAEMEQMDVRAKGRGGVETEADVESIEPEVELEVQADLEADPEIVALLVTDGPDRRAIDDEVLEGVEGKGQRGIISTVTVAKVVVRVVSRTLRRFAANRDHGVIPTVVEEVLRAAYVAQVGEWIWSGMKTAAEDMWKPNAGAVDESSHAGTYLLDRLARLQAERPDLEIDVIGHSAGSIAIAHMLEAAAERHPEFHVRNLILLAPAASADVFEQGILANRALFDTFRMFTMEDALESKDHLVPGVYPRSLLYLISGILDGEADSPVVGLHRHIGGQAPYDVPPLIEVSQFLANAPDRLVLSTTRDDAGEGLRSWSVRHGDFDDDEQTLASITAIIAK